MTKIQRTMRSAEYAIERWKRGLMILLIIALVVLCAALTVGIPLMLIGQITGEARWFSHGNIATATVLVGFPWLATNHNFLSVLKEMDRLQTDAHREFTSAFKS